MTWMMGGKEGKGIKVSRRVSLKSLGAWKKVKWLTDFESGSGTGSYNEDKAYSVRRCQERVCRTEIWGTFEIIGD